MYIFLIYLFLCTAENIKKLKYKHCKISFYNILKCKYIFVLYFGYDGFILVENV